MNRTIKFRGKRTDGNGWVYGDLRQSAYSGYGISVETHLPPTRDEPGGDITDAYYNVVDITVGQFTGLLDKHGVEVYEGDLVHDSPVGSLEDSYPVLYSPANAAFALKKKDWVNSCCLIKNLPEFYVTGNIHDKNNQP